MKDKETLLVAFSTQKGGAGKTTLTVLMASYFHYVRHCCMSRIQMQLK